MESTGGKVQYEYDEAGSFMMGFSSQSFNLQLKRETGQRAWLWHLAWRGQQIARRRAAQAIAAAHQAATWLHVCRIPGPYRAGFRFLRDAGKSNTQADARQRRLRNEVGRYFALP